MSQPSVTTQKDDNDFGAIFGISCIDGITPVRIKFDVSGGILIDTTTVISVTPKEITQLDANSVPIAKGISSANAKVILPWYVVPSTGAVLTDE